MIFIHVDDIIVAPRSESDKKELIAILQNELDLKELGKPQRILGIEIVYQ
jgi:hypothetical protein